MITLHAKKRNPKIKAKKLRREGFSTGVLFGSGLEDSVPLQFVEKEALRFIKENKEGTQVILNIDGTKTSAIVKSIDFDPMKKQIMALDLQALVAGEKISTTAPINFINQDVVQGVIEQELTEISYKATPANLLDIIDIDFETLQPGIKNLYVRDLKLDPDKDIELITSTDALIFHIADHTVSEDTDDESSDNTNS